MITHNVKVPLYSMIISGDMPFLVVRDDDHEFMTGQRLELVEVEPKGCYPTLRREAFTISYVLRDYPGIMPRYAVVGLKRTEPAYADLAAAQKEGK